MQVQVNIILTVMFPLMSVFTGANAVGLSVSAEKDILYNTTTLWVKVASLLEYGHKATHHY